jgi:hypothetical protein
MVTGETYSVTACRKAEKIGSAGDPAGKVQSDSGKIKVYRI